MEELREKCEIHKNCTNFVKAIICTINDQEENFQVSKLVNTTYDDFIYEARDSTAVTATMEDLKLVYFCLGQDFLLHQINPLN